MWDKLVAGWRHAVRCLAMALAALALSWGVTLTEGLVAALVGALAGVFAGEALGRSRLRLPVALGGVTLGLLGLWGLASLGVRHELLPELLGPGNALVFAAVLRFGGTALGLVTALRLVAVRRPSLLALELGVIAAAITSVFAAHRDGVIARPLALSDWAWRNDIDPVHVFLAIGAGSVVLLAVLLVVETRSGRGLSSLLALAALALLSVLFFNVSGLPQPTPSMDLGLTDAGTGGPPRRTPDAGGHGPSPNPGGDGGSGQRPGEDDGGGGPDSGGEDGGGAGLDGGDGGGGGAGQDAGDGGGGAGQDAGDGGGGAGQDAGEGGSSGGDGGDSGLNFPPPELSDGGVGQAPPPQDAGRPPPQDPFDNRDRPPGGAAPMAVVILDDDYSPPSGAYYFRQEVWSLYTGSRLVATNRNDADLDVVDDFPTLPTPAREVPPRTHRTRVRGMVALLVDHTHPFALESAQELSPTPNPNEQRFVRAWRFASLAQSIDYRRLVGRRAGNPTWSADLRGYYTQPPTDPRYRQLAQQVVDRALPQRTRRDPFAQALAIKLYLDRELIYSTRARHATTEDFLWGNRTGYCVHFAHSAVYLWRSLGIPSRISAGYHSDESNRRGGSAILLRSGDAHAWPELYLDGVGWVVLDIAAERNIDPPGHATDEDLQRILGEMARRQPPNPNTPPQDVRGPRPQTHYGRDLGYGLLYTLLAALGLLYAIKLWRRVIPYLASPRSTPRVSYRALLDRLAEAGLVRETGESREDFAKRIAGAVPSFERLTALHVAARLGNPMTAPEERPEYDRSTWSKGRRDVARELGQQPRPWRRLLGLLHPASWLDVH
ncbi:MAG: transglutaminase domain-containing protein [Deltaproteobacteria bacterium]|nr:transglutaminase domain-containing protein [Deltaproteobacteria bacterium]